VAAEVAIAAGAAISGGTAHPGAVQACIVQAGVLRLRRELGGIVGLRGRRNLSSPAGV